MKKGGDEKQVYDGKLISSSRLNIIIKRRDVYVCMTERCDTILKSFEKEDK
jgi:hypothetical protein